MRATTRPARNPASHRPRPADPIALYTYYIGELSKLGLAYLHLIMPRQFELSTAEETAKVMGLRSLFSGPAILAGGFDAASGAAALSAGGAEAICFGRHFLANPDMPKRFLLGAALNAYDRDTFYAPQHPIKGYTDYTFLGQEYKEGAVAVDPYTAYVA